MEAAVQKVTQGSEINEQKDQWANERMHVVFMATGNKVQRRNNHEHVNMFNVTVVIQFSAVEDSGVPYIAIVNLTTVQRFEIRYKPSVNLL